MTRRILIAGNWKMNGLTGFGRDLAGDLAARIKAAGTVPFEMLVCPPFPILASVKEALGDTPIGLGGQDCHMKDSGAHTGDTSAAMLKDVGCTYAIVGHSERRTDHAETNAVVKAKAEAALAAKLNVIVCIGETLDQRDGGKTMDVNRDQLLNSLPDGATAANTVVAYEPVWAIGTGRTASPEQAQEVHAMIRAELVGKLGAADGNGMRILYGGSMKPGNAAELLSQADIDGGLIGGAALKAEDFWAIAAACPK